MTFIYISGSGAGKDSWFMCVRVKAEAEDIFNKMKGNQFKDCYCVRPGVMKYWNTLMKWKMLVPPWKLLLLLVG